VPATAWIGTSGWQYDSWRGRLYPEQLAKRRWLEHYAERFRTVELNASFYRLPARDAFRRWHDQTPEDFVFAVKASRYLTHIRRLRDPAGPVARLLEAAEPLGSKLGPVLLQLPPTMAAEPDRLDATLACFPRAVRVAVEFRHRSWYRDEIRSILAAYGAALCLSDRHGRPQQPEPWRTAGWSYLRLHHGIASPRPCYGRTSIDSWARRMAERWRRGDVYVFFNNDPRGCAPRDAVRFAAAAGRRGLRPTRVPASAPDVGPART
jgi:uncharacterized protein YecE (DUF72 family)